MVGSAAEDEGGGGCYLVKGINFEDVYSSLTFSIASRTGAKV